MKAAVLVENKRIIISEIESKKPSNTEARVKIFSCGICGSDVPRYFENGARHYPLILGHEFFGQVIEIGKDVKNITTGDYVVGIPLVPGMKCEDCKNGDYSLCKNYKFIGSSLDGAYSEELTISSSNLFKIPKEVADENCALFEPATVALHGIKLINDISNKKVAVIGGGTIGEFTALWSQIYKAEKTILFTHRPGNEDVYKKIGIKNYDIINDDYKNVLYKYTSGGGFDIVFDSAGTNKSIISSLNLLKNHGKLCLIGTPTDTIVFTKKEWEIINRKELTIIGSWMSYSAPFPGTEWEETRDALLNKKLSFSDNYFAKKFLLCEVESAFDYIYRKKEGKIGRVLLLNHE